MKRWHISMLWLSAILLFLISAYVGRVINLSLQIYSDFLIFVSFNLALTAMLLQTIKNKDKIKNPCILDMDEDEKEKAMKRLFANKMIAVIFGFVINLIAFLT